jgi:hypothetical protein
MTQITREYMAEGYDGFEALKGRKFIIDDENGQIMSSIIRSFLLGEPPRAPLCPDCRFGLHLPTQTARLRTSTSPFLQDVFGHRPGRAGASTITKAISFRFT